MSQPDLESVSMPSVIVKKARYDVYFVMLVVALISLMMACLFLFLELQSFGGFSAYKGALSAVTPAFDKLAAYHVV